MKKELKNIIIFFLQSMMVFAILFWGLKVPLSIYAILSMVCCILVLIQFCPCKNRVFYNKIFAVLYGGNVAFLFVNPSAICSLAILQMIQVVLHCTTCWQYVVNELDLHEKLYGKRQSDLNTIKEKIKNKDFPIIGIEAAWGDGKTFFIKKLNESFQDNEKYEVITIDVLACNLDVLPQIIVDEMERVLYENGIISRYSKRLKNFFDKEKKIKFFGELLSESNESYAKAFCNLRKELKKLGKTILIVYEDLDRIVDKNVIIKIFYISEKLAFNNECVKILYQYDPVKLKEYLGDAGEPKYLEKYIPYTMKLSKVDFYEVIQNEIKENGFDKAILTAGNLQDFQANSMAFVKDIIQGIDLTEKINVVFRDIYSIRTVRYFLTDIYHILSRPNNRVDGDKHTIIAFFFIKHFLTEIYSRFACGKNLRYCFDIKNDDKLMPAWEVLRILSEKDSSTTKENMQMGKLFQDDEDIKAYIAYRFLVGDNYDLDVRDTEKSRSVVAESSRAMQQGQMLDQIESIIWHLVEAGQPVLTDYQWIVDNMQELILSKKKTEWDAGYREFEGKLPTRKFSADILTALWGKGAEYRWKIYFISFIATESPNQPVDYRGLLELYFLIKKPKKINDSFMANMKPFLARVRNGDSLSAFVILLKRMNDFDIEKDYRLQYKKFLQLLMDILKNLGFLKRAAGVGGPYDIYEDMEKDFRNIEKQLLDIKEKLAESQKGFEDSLIVIDEMCIFIKKVLASKPPVSSPLETSSIESETLGKIYGQLKQAGTEADRERIVLKEKDISIIQWAELFDRLKKEQI
ncbi:KAP family P-loop domain-containing protein [Propionispira arboris]|uniref:KAP family P-loop domain-containing protein n=1 Tax=Propionispira arboris TaxID=84035 RepID=A0A1H7D8U9_9FIRM|nr:P-loop NTPase fold protein [Propionispira arboris]SEJ96002.1 KAP family P-loop domain-containing protein [Propionispira arboris]